LGANEMPRNPSSIQPDSSHYSVFRDGNAAKLRSLDESSKDSKVDTTL